MSTYIHKTLYLEVTYSKLLNCRGAFSGTCVQISGATKIVFICSNKPKWKSQSCRVYAGWGITLGEDRVIPRTRVEGCPLSRSLPQACRTGSILRVRQREEENEMGKPSSRPPYTSVYQYHLSAVMALPPPTLCLVLNLLFILTFPYWHTNLAAASAFQPWDKSPKRIWLMDVFLEAVESGISPELDYGSASINHNHH